MTEKDIENIFKIFDDYIFDYIFREHDKKNIIKLAKREGLIQPEKSCETCYPLQHSVGIESLCETCCKKCLSNWKPK